jgi:recombination protein RecT
MTGTDVATHTPQQELVASVAGEQFQQQVALALPETIAPRRFVRATITAINQNPDLADSQKVERGSLFTALLRAAQDGLLPDGREAAIAPYKGKAQYLPMIGGYRKIAGDHGWQIVARVVYEADEFEFEEGLEPKLRHVRARPGVERGARVAAYATASHVSGAKAAPVVMYANEIDQRKAVAQTDRVWNAWTDRMWEKTVGKALFKELPIGELDPRVARVIAAEDVPPAAARALMYGSDSDTPAGVEAEPVPVDGGGGSGTQAAGPDQQAGAAAGSGESAPAASAPDPDDEPDVGEQPSPFQAPTDAQAVRDAADAAGRYTIETGKYKGKTIAGLASEKGGPGWIAWAIKAKDHAATPYAKSYARVYLPEEFQAAMAELQTKAQVS